MNRRGLMQAAAGSALLWSPYSRAAKPGRGHNAYFAQLNELLKQQGPGHPVLVLDQARMDRNIRRLVESVGKQKQYRIVVKSLPSVPLLQHVMQRSRSQALMVFHQPFLNAVAAAFPAADVLMGKPMPVSAARTFYRKLHNTGAARRFDPGRQLQWLIDSPERLQQYLQLARQLGVTMGVNFEIDVGLRRGGLTEPEQLSAALQVIAANPRHLRMRGLMGYEAHLTGMQASLQHPAVQAVLAAYRGFVQRLQQAGLDPAALTLNGAGSHTLKIYERDHTMNDLAAGSGVVMPTDFDTHHLAAHEPAVFIATPILKRYTGNPFTDQAPENMRRLYYIYGGYWKARMVSPDLVGDTIYQSTNQSPIATSQKIDLQVDDYMFLRPTQSEFVLLQFGDLLAVADGQLTGRWPVFHQTG